MTLRSVISSSSNFTLHLFAPRDTPEILQFNISDALIPLQSLPSLFHLSRIQMLYMSLPRRLSIIIAVITRRLWKIVLDKRATSPSDSALSFHETNIRDIVYKRTIYIYIYVRCNRIDSCVVMFLMPIIYRALPKITAYGYIASFHTLFWITDTFCRTGRCFVKNWGRFCWMKFLSSTSPRVSNYILIETLIISWCIFAARCYLIRHANMRIDFSI